MGTLVVMLPSLAMHVHRKKVWTDSKQLTVSSLIESGIALVAGADNDDTVDDHCIALNSHGYRRMDGHGLHLTSFI